MSQSKRDQILAAIATLLDAGGKPTGLQVSRNRVLPVTLDTVPAQIVYAADEQVNTGPGMGAGPTPVRKARRTLNVIVESRVAGGSSPDAALDPLLNWAVSQLCSDVSLGGLSFELKELGTVWSQVDAEAVFGAAKTMFAVDYVTSSSDLTQ